MAEAVATSYRREVQTSQCYKREVKKKNKKRRKEVHAGLMAAHTLSARRVGLLFPREPRVRPLAQELKTEARKRNHNTTETMDTVKMAFLHA